MFSNTSLAIIYGRHFDVGKRMLDFDFLSGRSASVAGFIDPNGKKTTYTKLTFGDQEILIPVYPSFSAIPKNDKIDTFLNFASFRSAARVTKDALESEIFEHIVIVAEGIPEREMREIIALNENIYKKKIIGPATAGAIAGGAFRLGNAGGSIDSIVESRLYKQGSIGFVSRSGGMSNEMYRVISKRTDGIHTGIALGGDRFVGSTFRDIVLEYEKNPEIKMIILLGEVGSKDELEIVKLLSEKKITKPVVAYVTGSLAEKLVSEVQFGHAGAKANANEETASFKNNALREAGAFVPHNYQDFGDIIEKTFEQFFGKPDLSPSADIVEKVKILSKPKKTNFTNTISDERGDELHYNQKPISEYVAKGSIANVIANLWLKRDLPAYALDFLDTVIILLADHGPAVSGAHNAIVTARA